MKGGGEPSTFLPLGSGAACREAPESHSPLVPHTEERCAGRGRGRQETVYFSVQSAEVVGEPETMQLLALPCGLCPVPVQCQERKGTVQGPVPLRDLPGWNTALHNTLVGPCCSWAGTPCRHPWFKIKRNKKRRQNGKL